jgi:hypothetical protein
MVVVTEREGGGSSGGWGKEEDVAVDELLSCIAPYLVPPASRTSAWLAPHTSPCYVGAKEKMYFLRSYLLRIMYFHLSLEIISLQASKHIMSEKTPSMIQVMNAQ